MQVIYSGTEIDLDQPAHEAELERPGQPVRLRVQPSILRKPAGAAGGHRAWPGVSWMIECRDAQEAIAVREALHAFFTALTQHGAAAVQRALTPGTTVQ